MKKKRTDNRTESIHNNKTIYTIHTALRSRATNTRWRSTTTELPIAHLRTYSTIPARSSSLKISLILLTFGLKTYFENAFVR